MKIYEDISGNSGVTAYEEVNDGIIVEFNYESVYKYTYASAGKRKIDTMKRLAILGKGLSSYISREVKDKFESKLK